jgi:DNA-binding IclR family transcriptional regulator
MRSAGFLSQRRNNGAYGPGPALEQLGAAVIRRRNVRRAAHPILEKLAQQTGETVSLSLLDGPNLHFVHHVEGTRYAHIRHNVGLVLPPSCAAAGKAILATMKNSDVKRQLGGGSLPTRTDSSLQTWDELIATLDDVRRRGFATAIDEGRRGLSAVGAPLRSKNGDLAAAISITVPSSRFAGDVAEELGDVLALSVCEPI